MAFLKVLIVDDSAKWRTFVQWQLSLDPEAQVVGIAADGLEAVQRAAELQPDVILLDIQLPILDGIEAARQIAQAAPHSAILLMSNESDPEMIRAAFSAGGKGFVLKRDIVDDLFAAMEAVTLGKRFLSRSLVKFDDLI